MKKLLIAALLVLSTASAFAGDSEPLKAILKAQTYTEASDLVKANLDKLTDNSEKAAAYKKVVDLAAASIKAEVAKVQADPNTDMKELAQATDYAFDAAQQCCAYDTLPNAKGKVKPKYMKALELELDPYRNLLINAGDYYRRIDPKMGFKLFAEYIDLNQSPIFSDIKSEGDPNIPVAGFFAGYSALMAKDYANVDKYIKYALNDSTYGVSAVDVQLQAMSAQLKTPEDTANYVNKLQAIAEKYPEDAGIFDKLVRAYSSVGRTADAERVVSERVAKNPKDYVAQYYNGYFLEEKEDWKGAEAAYKKALEVAPTPEAKCLSNSKIGNAIMTHVFDIYNKQKSVSTEAKKQFDKELEPAATYLEAAKALDSKQDFKTSYAYPLYRVYYFLDNGKVTDRVKAAADFAGVTLE